MNALQGVTGLGDAELFDLGNFMVEENTIPLGEGARRHLRAKFSLSAQKRILHEIEAYLSDGTFNTGSWRDGEIEITGIKRIYTHRFWTELQVWVLMPPPPGKQEPVKAAFAGTISNLGLRPGASVLVIPDEDHIALVRMYRFHSLGRQALPDAGKGWRLEAPRGGKLPDETLAECALREAEEESGASATEDSKLIYLGDVEPDSGGIISSQPLYALVGAEIDSAKIRLDVTEAPTRTEVLAVDDVLDMVLAGMIPCGITNTLIFRALAAGLIKAKRPFSRVRLTARDS